MIRHVGVSNHDAKQIDELSEHGRVETLQPPYHMFRRDIEAEILPYTKAMTSVCSRTARLRMACWVGA